MQRRQRPLDPTTGRPLLKMRELVERSGLPAPTILHYVHEGLLQEPTARTGRSMAWYAEASVEQLKLIRRLQHDHFLPLAVIRELLREGTDPRLIAAAGAVSGALPPAAPDAPMPSQGQPAQGLSDGDLAELVAVGLLTTLPQPGQPVSAVDAEVMELLTQARANGLGADVLSVAALRPYKAAVAELVRFEVALFRDTVLRGTAMGDLTTTHAAVALSEAFVVHMRRRLLLPALLGEPDLPKEF